MLISKERPRPKVKNIEVVGKALILDTQHGKIKLEPFSDRIIRVVYTLSDDFSRTVGPGIVETDHQVQWDFEENTGEIVLRTKSLRLLINKETCAIKYYNSQNILVLKEPECGGKLLEGFSSYRTILDENTKVEKIMTPDGVKEKILEAEKVFDRELYHSRLELEWAEDEALYGMGQQEEGVLNLRGSRQYLHQANMKIPQPFLISTKGYGLLFNTYSPLIFNDNAYGSYIYSEAVDEMDFFFVVGNNFDDIISGYRTLSGKATMMPKWAFGYMQSKERYESQDDILQTVDEYRRRDIPLDSIVLDWQSWEEGQWGQKTFDATRFPDVEGMIANLHKKGVHFMMSIWPNMHSSSQNYAQMKLENTLFQQSEIYNAFDEKARTLYWNQANSGLFSRGIDAWWCDSSEPFTPEWNQLIRPEPDQNLMDFHATAKNYMDESLTNAYPLFHARTMYEGQRSVTKEKRVINLTRSGYIGQQRYGTILWSGDISANWKTLKNQIPAGLNLCAAGIPYWTLDIGAFFVKRGHVWFWDGDYEGGCEDLGYRELYTRWLQLGTFLPVFRSHGTDTPREIWQFGEKGEMFYDVIAKFIRLRYQLMPYIYSLGGQVTQNDSTIMRLLAFDFPNDQQVYNIKDQYMFGNHLMVCPVTEPMYYEKKSEGIINKSKTRQVYLPTGSNWYDYWTGKYYQGNQTMTAQAPIDIMPIYIKAGTILIMADVALHTGESSEQAMDIVIYPGDSGSFTLYQDEGDNYNYEKGEFSQIIFNWDDENHQLTIKDRIGAYKGMFEIMNFKVKLVGNEETNISYSGKKVIINL